MNYSPANTEGYLIKTNDTGYTGCNEAPAGFTVAPLQRTLIASGTSAQVLLNEGFATLTVDPFINQFGQICSWIGIDDPTDEIQPQVFPNPVANSLSIRNPTGFALNGYIHDGQGKEIRRITIEGHSTIEFSTDQLPAGIYLLRCEGFAAIRFVKA